MVEGWRTTGIVAALAMVAAAAPASAGSPPKLGTYSGTSTTNAAKGSSQSFGLSISRGLCAPAGGKLRRTGYCVTVNVAGGPQASCADGSIVEEFFPVSEQIALSAKRTIAHAYTLYAGPDGQVGDRSGPGTQRVGTFVFSLAVSASGTAQGTMNYSAAGCTSGTVKITAKHR